MKIIIVGCGKIGKSLIGSLVSEGHDVAVIDKNPAVIEAVTNTYDVIGLCGIGTDCEALAEAGAARADIVICVTGSDELNMLACYIARTLGAKNTVARIRDREYNDKSLGFMATQLQLSMSINPEMSAAQTIANILRFPTAVNIDTFDGNKFEIIEMILGEGSPLAGMNMIELRKNRPGKFLICAVMRENEIIIPDGRFVLNEGDRIALTAAPNEIGKLLRSFDLITRKTKNVMILGASRIAYYLSLSLLAAGNNVTVIDKNEERCDEFAESLPGVTVIHGDGANQDMLIEEGLGTTDAFVALTGFDENNILISYFATSQNVPKVIAKVNLPEYYPIAGKLGIDTIVTPTETVTDEMLRYVRALQNSVGSNVEKLYKIMDGGAEALEFNVRSDFKYAGKALKEIKFKPNILIAGILRNRKPIVPSGDDIILPGDKVIVIAANHRLYDLSDIIA